MSKLATSLKTVGTWNKDGLVSNCQTLTGLTALVVTGMAKLVTPKAGKSGLNVVI